MTAIAPNPISRPSKPWYHPTLSPEHGVYVMIAVAFLTGAAAAQHWTGATTLALMCAYCGFQAEHPLSLQIKQRHSWKPRFLVWAGGYGGVAIAIALWLLLQSPEKGPLLWLGGVVMTATLIDSLAVWQRQQKSVWNELVTFAAACLAAPLAYIVTTGTWSPLAIALWVLNTAFFASAIFTVKLRKARTASVQAGLVFHAIATGLVLMLWQMQWLPPFPATAFGIALLKFGLIVWQRDWYCHAPIQRVAMLETGASSLFLAIAALSVLPAHLN